MNQPLLTVLVPAYNCGPYLALTIESILGQTFTDFELLLINDGSTDQTEQTILSFSDPRIVYLKNDRNHGIVYTLNRGIDAARGQFIARMDGDDLCLPDRFEKQIRYFQQNPDCRFLAGTIELMDANGQFSGYWEEERKVITPEAIRKRLIRENCLAHPTIMARTELLKQYKYTERQKNTEDYDLWLRLAADGIALHKIPDTLIRHRFFPQSVTRKDKKNIYYKNARAKFEFVRGRRKEKGWNGFTFRVYLSACLDLLRGFLKNIKNRFR